MTLREKQSVFAAFVPRLIDEARRQGFDVTLGECWRSDEEAARLAKLGKGIPNSLHRLKLAIDINLFRDGRYLSSSEAHRPLGEWWEKQTSGDLVFAWGGRFDDGNHYSIAHGRYR